MIPDKKSAQTAGLIFLLMVVFDSFAEIFFRQKLFITNDTAATANNILSNGCLYRARFTSDILIIPNESIERVLLIPGTIAELSFMLWLLIRRISESKLQVQKNQEGAVA